MRNILTVIVDIHGLLHYNENVVTDILESLCIFMKAYLALRIENEIRIMTTVVPRFPCSNNSESFDCSDMTRTIEVVEFFKQNMKVLQSKKSSLSCAMSSALCFLNKRLDKYFARIMYISFTKDLSSEYIGIMNCVFAAKKLVCPVVIRRIFLWMLYH